MFHNVIKFNMYKGYWGVFTMGWGTLPTFQFLQQLKCCNNSLRFMHIIVTNVEKSTVKCFRHKKFNFLERYFFIFSA